MANIPNINNIDKKILQELQKNGRITYAELARRVGLSTSPCLERVKRMEREGIINGYTALLNPTRLGADMVVIVQIRLQRTSQDIFEKFKKAAFELEEAGVEIHAYKGIEISSKGCGGPTCLTRPLVRSNLD